MTHPIREGDRLTFADTDDTYTGIVTDIRAGRVRGTTVITLAQAQCTAHFDGCGCEREAGHFGQHRVVAFGEVKVW